ncbi:MAG: hypothetical protein ACRCT8_17755 [Lacipirellulaceae bacterium]
MNYLAHAWPLLLAPERHTPDELALRLAGVAVPDWLGVVARRTRCRSRHAAPYAVSPDWRVAALAQGVLKHHVDDGWFHDSEAFLTLSQRFTTRIAAVQHAAPPGAQSPRAWFVGHILVELLLDAELASQRPELLDCYYGLIATIDRSWVAQQVARMAGGDVGELAAFIAKYVEMRFLADYGDDERLAMRINQVLARVGLDPLPGGFLALLAPCRHDVRQRLGELLSPPPASQADAPQTNRVLAA